MFNGSTLVTGGIFNQINNFIPSDLGGLLLLRDASAPGALHNSSERFDPPKCHPSTRRAVLRQIMEWAQGSVTNEKHQFILWLHGAAGAGKSAIAQTLAEICSREGILLACFFFGRSSPQRNTVQRLVATLAYQIALAIPATANIIKQLVEANPMIFDQSFDFQLQQLIVHPLLQITSSSHSSTIPPAPHILIIDGLDECKDASIQAHIVTALSNAFQHPAFGLRILIASRPELHLKVAFNSRSIRSNLTTCVLDNRFSPNEDIWLYLESSFEDIKQSHPFRRYIPLQWPGDEVMQKLVKKSSGQFIYASTVVKYVGSFSQRPVDRLKVVLGVHPSSDLGNLPFAELDALYAHIFSGAQDIERTMDIVAAVLVLEDRNTGGCFADHIDDFFSFEPGDTEMCLSPLASVIECVPESGEIIVLHASLMDWIFDQNRSGPYFIRKEDFLVQLLRLGLHHMQQNTGFKHPYMHVFPRSKYWMANLPLLKISLPLCDDLHQLSLAKIWASCNCDELSISRFWAFVAQILGFLNVNSPSLCHRFVEECYNLLLLLFKSSPIDTSPFLVTMDLLLGETDTGHNDDYRASSAFPDCDFESDWLFLFGGTRFISPNVKRTNHELLATYSFACLFNNVLDAEIGYLLKNIFRDLLSESGGDRTTVMCSHKYAKAAHRYWDYATSGSIINPAQDADRFVARQDVTKFVVQYLPRIFVGAAVDDGLLSSIQESKFPCRYAINGVFVKPSSIRDLQNYAGAYRLKAESFPGRSRDQSRTCCIGS